MRTYILALTKYGIAAVMIAYTVLAFYLVIQKDEEVVRRLTLIQNILILTFQLISYFTLFIALKDGRYMLFAFLVMAAFFAIFLLYRTLYRHANMPLFDNMCLLLSVGLVVQSRLSFDNAVHQMMIASMGLVIAFCLPIFRRQFSLLKSFQYIYGMVGIAILAVVMLLGATTLGANITYTIAGVTFQPSEFVKILYILFLASTLKDVRDLKDFAVVTAFAAAHVLILVGSKDLGSGLIFFVVYLFMAFLATGEWLVLAGGFGLGGIGAVACYFMFSHIRERVQAFIDPWSLIDSIGYQITQSLFAIGAGGIFGVGLGQGTPSDVPFVESDFVFAAVCEELGQLVGICIILVGISCFLVMLELAAGFADRFYRLMAYGAAICYVFQMFLTLGGQTKFIPLTGVTLPFISYGGSSILSTLIIFTLIEAMCILRGEKIEEIRRKRIRAQQLQRRASDRYREQRRYRNYSRRELPQRQETRNAMAVGGQTRELHPRAGSVVQRAVHIVDDEGFYDD
jgi:cell division protein FtsW (lipid II flippase)